MDRSLPFLLTLALAAPAAAGAEAVRLGQVSLSFYAVTGEVVRTVLEENGHTVETVEGGHAAIYPMLGTGEVDLLAASWLPNGHEALFADVADEVEQLTPLYENARFFWAVPSHVPDEAVSEVADLAKPEIAARMADVIPTLAPATGLTVGAERMMTAYGLRDAGYDLVPGTATDWSNALEAAVATGDWIVLPLWQPHWLNIAHDLRRLDDPRDVYGPDDTGWLVARRDLRERLDARTMAHLEAIRLPIDAVTQMDAMVNVDGMTPAEAARAWIAANPDIVAAWRPE